MLAETGGCSPLEPSGIVIRIIRDRFNKIPTCYNKMFCPNCGIDEKQPNQFCRACGTNLLPVREVVARPDGVTASAITAREEIGRAVAAKIRETQNVHDLKKVAEDVLPEIEKFLESPEEKRVRRIRVGVLIALIGFGATMGFLLAGIFAKDLFVMLIPAIVTVFIGVAFFVNGRFFTVPKKTLSDTKSDADRQRERDGSTSGLNLPKPSSLFSSVTENTTKHLTEKQPKSRG